MKNIKYYIILIILTFSIIYSQDNYADRCIYTCPNSDFIDLDTDTLKNRTCIYSQSQNFKVHFRFDNHNLDPNYMNNGISLQKFANKIDSIGILNIDSIIIVSQSSPEGVYEHNLKLSKKRANTMRKYILEKYPELYNCLYVYDDGESWEQLREHVMKDSLMKKSTKEKIISIIDADINVGTKKWRIQQLPIYKYLLKTYYPRIRNSSFYILYYNDAKIIEPIDSAIKPKLITEIIESELITDDIEIESDTIKLTGLKTTISEYWIPRLHLKTNALGWPALLANIAAEMDIIPHLSFSLPLYYSALNYFSSTLKFRTFAIQPEVRYWLSPNNAGLFAGVHFGLFSYNVAVDGDYRYQDHNGNSPAIGGGISLGYRLSVSDNKRWNIEFTIGAGVYDLYYDKFYNTHNGKLVETCRKTYWGIDNIGVNISYRFNINKIRK